MKIFNNVVIKLGFSDRLRVLAGRKIRVNSSIEVDRFCSVVESDSQTFVEPLLPAKSKPLQLRAHEHAQQQDAPAEQGRMVIPNPIYESSMQPFSEAFPEEPTTNQA